MEPFRVLPRPSFCAADSFEGAREGGREKRLCLLGGYFFGSGGEGLGYYRDVRQPRRPRPRGPQSEIWSSQTAFYPRPAEHVACVPQPLVEEAGREERQQSLCEVEVAALPDYAQKFLEAEAAS